MITSEKHGKLAHVTHPYIPTFSDPLMHEAYIPFIHYVYTKPTYTLCCMFTGMYSRDALSQEIRMGQLYTISKNHLSGTYR